VEFGACDGVHLSNTYLLEKTLAWRGVVAEPWPAWHQTLKEARTCLIETRCVWSSSGAKIKFSGISKDPVLSTASELLYGDLHANERKSGGQEEIEVETISLNDLLHNSQAPRDLDYLSMDTEGSELRILESLDFSRWQPKIITVEHNYSAQREQIYRLLSAQGYGRELEPFSKWDDWYFHPSIAAGK
jgi:FkbM family methyltransferase